MNKQGSRGKVRHVYFVYDARAREGAGTDGALAVCVEPTLDAARKWREWWSDGCIYRYSTRSSTLYDETWVEDF